MEVLRRVDKHEHHNLRITRGEILVCPREVCCCLLIFLSSATTVWTLALLVKDLGGEGAHGEGIIEGNAEVFKV